MKGERNPYKNLKNPASAKRWLNKVIRHMSKRIEELEAKVVELEARSAAFKSIAMRNFNFVPEYVEAEAQLIIEGKNEF